MFNWLAFIIALACAIGYFLENKNGYSKPTAEKDPIVFRWVSRYTNAIDLGFWLPIIGWFATATFITCWNVNIILGAFIAFVVWWVLCAVLQIVTDMLK